VTIITSQAVFYYMAAASVASATLAVTRKNPVHSMLWVLALFLHVAGIFLLLGAEFLAAVQVDVPGEEARPRFGKHWPLAAAAGLGFVALSWLARVETPDAVGAPAEESLGSLSEVGLALFGPFALPFEMASLVLLAAIVGAVVLARRRATES
jgi:NADH-quinone oxidoreductase subunit J